VILSSTGGGCDGLAAAMESAAAHLNGNKFVSFDYWGASAGVRSLINCHNQSGPIFVDMNHAFIDHTIQSIFTKGQNTPATITVRNSNFNRDGGTYQILAAAPDGSLTLKLDNAIHAAPKAFGNVVKFSLNPAEASAIYTIPYLPPG
jgi:hypothetical protein